MLEEIWSNRQYHQKISEWDKLDHPALLEIFQETKEVNKILDVGCGDGTKLSKMGGRKKTGTEVTAEIIAIARKKHPKFIFIKAVGEKLPFLDNSFDAVTCLFVLEHTKDPQKVIDEIIRVTIPGGKFYLLAPNFGAPNRASPNFKGSRFYKLLTGLINDPKTIKTLNWHKVKPQTFSIENFQPDLDTTVEPYLGSLIKYLMRQKVKILKTSSFWNMELPSANLMQKICRLFKANWGPHLFVVAQKS